MFPMHMTTKFNAKHDVILLYTGSTSVRVRMDAGAMPYDRAEKIKDLRRKVHKDESGREWIWDTRGHAKGQQPYKRYSQDIVAQGRALADVWTDIPFLRDNHPERHGSPTQKPLALLHRIIQASSLPGGLVLNPFCGCATALGGRRAVWSALAGHRYLAQDD